MNEVNVCEGRVPRGRLAALVGACLIALCGVLLMPLAADAVPTTGIEGRVTNALEPSEAMEGVEVCAFEATSETELNCETTSSTGEYTLEEPAGEYRVRFSKSGFVTGWYGYEYEYARSWSEAEGVPVSSGAPTSDIDFQLTEEGEGTLSGTATDASTGQGIAGVEVCANGETALDGYVYRCTEAGAGGQYSIASLPAGNYYIEFSPGMSCEEEMGVKIRCSPKVNYIREDSSATVRANQTATANAKMTAGGAITGTVTNASITHPALAKVEVCATEVNGKGVVPSGKEAEAETEFGYGGGCAYTNSAGQYAILGLSTSGSYKIEFDGYICAVVQEGATECPEAYVTQYYPGQPNFKAATPVAVTLGAVTSGINESLHEAFPVVPASTGAPALTGTPSVGSTLTCSAGTWAHEPLFLSYQWLRSGKAISGQTASTYKVQGADTGQSISCVVTAGNGAGTASATSNALKVAKPIAVAGKAASVKGHAVLVSLRCTGGGACKGSLELTAKSKGKSVKIGSAHFSLAAGKSTKVHVHLTAKGSALLQGAGKTVKAKLTGSGVKSRALTIKQSKKAKHHKK